MTKTYRFLLAAGVSLVLAFTFSACGDGKDDFDGGNGACYTNTTPIEGVSVCTEWPTRPSGILPTRRVICSEEGGYQVNHIYGFYLRRYG